MSGISAKATGLANAAMGKIKQKVGSAVGSEELRAEGAMQEAKGVAQKSAAEVNDAAAMPSTETSIASNRRDEIVRERAYEIWLEQGYPEGRHLDHWRQAESEISFD